MRFLSALVLVFASVALERLAGAAASDKPGWQLTFQDEFDSANIDASGVLCSVHEQTYGYLAGPATSLR
jgi:hypothetical protein